MKKLQLFVLLGFTLAAISSYSTAFAADRAGAMSFTFGGGSINFSSKRHLENTGVGFAAVGYDFTDRWGIEGLLGVSNTHYKRHEHHVNRGRAVNLTMFSLDAMYHFTPCHPKCTAIEPYLMAGVGILGQNKGKSAANNQGNINAGVGVAFFVDKSIAFRVEGRDLYTPVGGKNDVMLDAGISFLLDIC